MEEKSMNFESHFDINDVHFRNVNSEFEENFRHRYNSALAMMSDSHGRLKNASGANTLGILEKMAQRINYYDRNSDFEKSYNELLKEYEPFTET